MKHNKIKITILEDGSGFYKAIIPRINPNIKKYPTFEEWKKAHGYL
jgi:hypothetical protein